MLRSCVHTLKLLIGLAATVVNSGITAFVTRFLILLQRLKHLLLFVISVNNNDLGRVLY